MTRPLRMTDRAFKRVQDEAMAAGRNECMGLLAAPPGERIVTEAVLLPATSSPRHAVTEPLALARAMAALRARLVPMGIWHSHGTQKKVFHSRVDRLTDNRLLPGFANRLFEHPDPALVLPAVTGPDSAVLPMPDGDLYHFALRGRAVPIPGLEASEVVSWDGAATRFQETLEPPNAVFTDRTLRLSGGHIVVELGIPLDAAVEVSRQPAAARMAFAFSLVVNVWGEHTARCMAVADLCGHSFTRSEPCAVEVIRTAAVADPGGPPPRAGAANGRRRAFPLAALARRAGRRR